MALEETVRVLWVCAMPSDTVKVRVVEPAAVDVEVTVTHEKKSVACATVPVKTPVVELNCEAYWLELVISAAVGFELCTNTVMLAESGSVKVTVGSAWGCMSEGMTSCVALPATAMVGGASTVMVRVPVTAGAMPSVTEVAMLMGP